MKPTVLKLILTSACSLASTLPAQAADLCTAFPSPNVVGAVLNKPGNYCMTQDLVVKELRAWYYWESGGSSNQKHYAMVVSAGDVVIDLGGKAIRSNAGATFSGVLGSVVPKPVIQRESNFSDRVNSIDWSKVNKNITIKNGSIELDFVSGKWANNPFGILLATDGEWYELPDGWREQEFLFRSDFSYLPRDRKNYPNRKITLENLTIRTPGYGIAVFGAGTVIRNCTIVTESGVGIWSFGGGAVIENNTITVRRNKRLAKTFLPTDAAIVLQDGHGSVVRNNVMRLESDGVGISLVSSDNVTMVDNVTQNWIGRRSPVSVRDFK